MVHTARTNVRISEAGDPLDGYLTTPGVPGPWPGVVVIHEAWGFDDQTVMSADRLASMGFLALAPRLYRGSLRCVRSVVQSMASGTGPVFADLDATRRHLIGRDDCTGKVGVVGFCMGGGFALVLASTGEYDAAAPNYGSLPHDLSELERSCPVVASYGGKDRSLKGVAQTLERTLTEYGVPHDVKEYPSAGHSFLNTRQNAPVVIRPMVRAAGGGPEPEAAVDAWRRMGAFLHEHLG